MGLWTSLRSYLAPTDLDYRLNADGKKVFSPKTYNKRISFDDALPSQVMSRYGLDLAHCIPGAGGPQGIPAWRKKASSYRWPVTQAGADPYFSSPGPH